MDSAEMKDWVDFVVSLSNIDVEHPFDLLYFHNKMIISSMKFALKIPAGLERTDSLLFYLNVFNSTYGTALFSLDVKTDFCCRTLFDSVMPNWQWRKETLVKWSYVWSKELLLSKLDPGFLISWPDFLSRRKVTISVHGHGLNVSSLTTLSIYWMHIHQYEIIYLPYPAL